MTTRENNPIISAFFEIRAALAVSATQPIRQLAAQYPQSIVVAVDIETLGLSPDAAVMEIAAAVCTSLPEDPALAQVTIPGRVPFYDGRTFYGAASPYSACVASRAAGRSVDHAALMMHYESGLMSHTAVHSPACTDQETLTDNFRVWLQRLSHRYGRDIMLMGRNVEAFDKRVIVNAEPTLAPYLSHRTLDFTSLLALGLFAAREADFERFAAVIGQHGPDQNKHRAYHDLVFDMQRLSSVLRRISMVSRTDDGVWGETAAQHELPLDRDANG